MQLYLVNLKADMNGDNRDYLVAADDPRQAYDLWWQRQLDDDLFDPQDTAYVADRLHYLPDRIYEVPTPTAAGVLDWGKPDGARIAWDRKLDSSELLGVPDLRTPTPSP